MSYYRAALAAARSGDLTNSARLAQYSLSLNEEADANGLLELLRQQNSIDAETLDRLRILITARRYRKALKIKLPQTSKVHTIRGLLYAQMGRHRKARTEFAQAIVLDTGNDLAKLALREVTP